MDIVLCMRISSEYTYKNMIIYVYVYAKDLRKYVEGVCSDWIENNGTLNSQRGNKPKTQTLQIEMEAEANHNMNKLRRNMRHALTS